MPLFFFPSPDDHTASVIFKSVTAEADHLDQSFLNQSQLVVSFLLSVSGPTRNVSQSIVTDVSQQRHYGRTVEESGDVARQCAEAQIEKDLKNENPCP